jgi:hypothetical protein
MFLPAHHAGMCMVLEVRALCLWMARKPPMYHVFGQCNRCPGGCAVVGDMPRFVAV